MDNFKKHCLKEIKRKISALQLGIQEPLIDEFTQIQDCINIATDLQSMIIRLKILKEVEDFNNKNKGAKCQ